MPDSSYTRVAQSVPHRKPNSIKLSQSRCPTRTQTLNTSNAVPARATPVRKRTQSAS